MSLLKNFATVGAGTASSRILGFVRDILIARAFGAGPVADAFFVAFRFPNLFRRLFAEGAFNAAFIPLFAKELEGGGTAAARKFGEEALAALLFLLLVLVALAEIAMPVLMLGLAPGFATDPDKFNLAVLLTRICFPYLIFVSLMALFAGVLNAAGRFVAAAFAPTLLNVVFILALTGIDIADIGGTPHGGVWLSWAVFAGGIIQLIMVAWAARRAGLMLLPRRPRLTPNVRRMFHLMGPGIIAGGITQINIVIGTMIASLAPNAVTYLYMADRIYQLPLGIVGIAIGVVLLPDIARRLRAGDMGGVDHQQNRAAEFALALTLPASVAIVLIPQEIIRGLFEGGNWDREASIATASALTAFGFGLPAFVLIKVFSPGFFAREDTKTPMWFAGVNTLLNVALSLALFPWLQHVGIAIATSIGGWANAVLLAWTLHRRGHFKIDQRLTSRIWRILHACVWMGAALVGVRYLTVSLWPAAAEGGATANIVLLAILVATGLVVYAMLSALTGVLTRDDLRTALRRRRDMPSDPNLQGGE